MPRPIESDLTVQSLHIHAVARPPPTPLYFDTPLWLMDPWWELCKLRLKILLGTAASRSFVHWQEKAPKEFHELYEEAKKAPRREKRGNLAKEGHKKKNFNSLRVSSGSRNQFNNVPRKVRKKFSKTKYNPCK